MSHLFATPGLIAERGTTAIASGKASVTAPACTTTSIVIVTFSGELAEKLNAGVMVKLEAGKFKAETSTGAGTGSISWAILS